jgi:PAS domain S-box-containing protein
MDMPSRIQIVDDSPETNNITRKVLATTDVNYVVSVATNGLEALAQINENIPDLIITDWDMPEMNGIQLIESVRNDEKLKDIPIIMVTGMMVTSESLKNAFDAGATDFLKKPFDKTELLSRVKSLLALFQSIDKIKNQNIIIEEHSRFINSLLSSVPLPMVYYNLEGIILKYNEKFKEIFNKPLQDILGSDIYQICPNPKEMKQLSDDMIRNTIVFKQFETSLNTSSEKVNDFIVTKTIYFNHNNQPEGFICVFSDITEIKQTHEDVLEGKKRELVASAIRLIQMSEMNTKLIDDLTSLIPHSDKDGKEIINGIIAKYRLNSLESSWKEFETRFEKVYEEFYASLSKLHPDLTPGEKKISALLRLSLSSKDIAALTFQDAKSVDMARYRLRKKLNLSQEDNLVDYLMKI